MGFKFKQFTIEHDTCAMKVSTDSIMLGSWVCTKNIQRVLDIGTGSGLLAIMLAQRTQESCSIEGIDIDSVAITQAKENAYNCPWTQRLRFQHARLQNFPITTAYDLIVSNPPYFPINVTANKTQLAHNRLNARQTIELDHSTLLQEVTNHLSDNGHFYCVLPTDVAKVFTADAESLGLYCIRELQVQAKQYSNITRLLLEFSRSKKAKISEKIRILV